MNMTPITAAQVLLLWALIQPILLGVFLLLQRPLSEALTTTLARWHAFGLALITLVLTISWARNGFGTVEHSGPELLHVHHYIWTIEVLIDGYAIAYLTLLAAVYSVIVTFSIPGFHRAYGAARFWFLVSLATAAMAMLVTSGNIDGLYLGWELVGLCSVLLIGFFRRNTRSAYNSLRALIYYRICDIGFLGTAVWMHHAFPTSQFSHLADNHIVESARYVAFGLLFATLAKSAQLPMSPWLHRAMEGPSSSSAIFYGALSTHLGVFVLLRTSPLWFGYTDVRIAMAAIGLITGGYATLVGSTRPDVKTSIAYAAMTQIGLMYVELALGLHTLAMFHILAHAGLRTTQFLRASAMIQEFQNNPAMQRVVHKFDRPPLSIALIPKRFVPWFYVASIRLFWIDAIQQWFVTTFWQRPLRRIAHTLDRAVARLLTTSHRAQTSSWPAKGLLLAAALGVVMLRQQAHEAHGHDIHTGLFLTTVFASLLFGAAATASRHALVAIWLVILSQVALALGGLQAGPVGIQAAGFQLISLGLCGWVVISSAEHATHQSGITTIEAGNGLGLADGLPLTHAIFFVAGWLLVGVPGGAAFFSEDLLFHAFVEQSALAALTFVVAAGLNAIAIYRVYLALFSGRVLNPHIFADLASRRMTFRIVAVLVVLGLGIFPGAFFLPL